MRLLANRNFQVFLRVLPYIIMVAGVVLRVGIYLQNRCLIVDEANVVRNLYERDFAGLLRPLSYEQYAPPLFLWGLKLSTLAAGFSEYAVKLLPLLSSIFSLWLLYRLLKRYTRDASIWYVMLLFASGMLYVRYATEVKQYASDMAMALALLLFALRWDILRMPVIKFMGYWLLAGSLAIWFSMPSVFVLAGVGAYYFYLTIKAKAYNKLLLTTGVGLVWAVQFAAYYFLILKPQIHSEYLQSWHSRYFLNVLPLTGANWLNNWDVFSGMLGNMAGHWALSVTLHVIAIAVGGVWLVRRQTAQSILVLLPILLMLTAAFMHEYTLIPRVAMFSAPLLFVLIAKGMELMLSTKLKVLNLIVIVACLICIWNFNSFYLLSHRMEVEETTASLDYMKSQNISGTNIYTNEVSMPGYIYYTSIHPDKRRYSALLGAKQLYWNTDYEQLGKTFKNRTAILNSYIDDHAVYGKWHEELRLNNKEVGRHDATNSHVVIYEPK